MALQFFALPGVRRRSWVGAPKCNSALVDLHGGLNRPFTKPSNAKLLRMVAVWRVSEETGRLECIWTSDADPDTGDDLRQMIARVGLLLAVYQQGRFAA